MRCVFLVAKVYPQKQEAARLHRYASRLLCVVPVSAGSADVGSGSSGSRCQCPIVRNGQGWSSGAWPGCACLVRWQAVGPRDGKMTSRERAVCTVAWGLWSLHSRWSVDCGREARACKKRSCWTTGGGEEEVGDAG